MMMNNLFLFLFLVIILTDATELMVMKILVHASYPGKKRR